MADATQSYLFFNGGIDVDVIKVEQDTTKSFKDAVAQKDIRFADTTLFNTFDKNLDANYNPPVETSALSTITIYRKTPQQTYYDFICFLSKGQISFYDFNIVNQEYYHYLAAIPITVRGDNGLSMEYRLYQNRNSDGSETFHKAYWKSWSLTNIRESETVENTYEQYGYTWNLKCNIEGENITQNTSVTSWDTLGRFPKISMGKKKYDSSTFTGLLGDVVEFTQVEEKKDEFGQMSHIINKVYRYTERFPDSWNFHGAEKGESFEKVKYANEMEKLIQWKSFISDGSLKLLKDLKGNSWIIQVLENAEYDIDNKPHSAPAMITFSWQEVEDVSSTAIVNMDFEKG